MLIRNNLPWHPLQEPFKLELQKTFCCFFCKSGPLQAFVSIPVKGYVPGEIIPVNIEIDNGSTVRVHRVQITLRKTVTFKANVKITWDRKKIATLTVGCVDPGKSRNWIESMEIPYFTPSNLKHCNVINVEYDLLVRTPKQNIQSYI